MERDVVIDFQTNLFLKTGPDRNRASETSTSRPLRRSIGTELSSGLDAETALPQNES